MAVKQITPKAEVAAYLAEQLERLEAAIINAMAYAGVQCTREAREGRNYLDHTGNLRSSTGFAILVNGKVHTKGGFEQVARQGKQPKGAVYDGDKVGEKFLLSVIKEFPRGIVLVVVAGMKYAAAVSDYGFNVLDSSERMADRIVPQILDDLGLSKK